MKNNRFQILEIGTFCSVKFIAETVKDSGNPSTSIEISRHNPFNNKKMTSELDKKKCIIWAPF